MNQDQIIRLISDRMQKTHKAQMDTVIIINKKFGFSGDISEIRIMMTVVDVSIKILMEFNLNFDQMLDAGLVAQKVVDTGEIGIVLAATRLAAAVRLSGKKDIPEMLEYFTAVMHDAMAVEKEMIRLREEIILQSN